MSQATEFPWTSLSDHVCASFRIDHVTLPRVKNIQELSSAADSSTVIWMAVISAIYLERIMPL